MFIEIGETEMDTCMDALELLKIYKIQQQHGDYNISNICLGFFDADNRSYNLSYDDDLSEIIELIYTKISPNITSECYSDEFSYIIDENSILEDEVEDILDDTRIILIPVSSNKCDINNVIEEVEKIICNLGVTEEYFDKTIFYENDYISIIIDKTAGIDLLINVELVELLYKYKREDLLL